MPTLPKGEKRDVDKEVLNLETVKNDAKSIARYVCGDISKTSASKQILLGASSGWVTGFLAIRIGKTVAFALGGGIILLQIASEKGYIKINWDKVNKVKDKVEDKITGQEPSWTDKMERYVDRVEDKLRDKQKKAKHWYSDFLGDNNCQLKEVHIFLVSFVAGVALGIGTS